MPGVDARIRLDAAAKGRVVEFDGDDEAYLDWLSVYPDGYVVNVRRKLSSDYVVLHRATCGSIGKRGGDPGGHTERAFLKFCGGTQADVAGVPTLCGRAYGSFSSRCGFCKP